MLLKSSGEKVLSSYAIEIVFPVPVGPTNNVCFPLTATRAIILAILTLSTVGIIRSVYSASSGITYYGIVLIQLIHNNLSLS
jgi:hypothetical protein